MRDSRMLIQKFWKILGRDRQLPRKNMWWLGVVEGQMRFINGWLLRRMVE